MEITGLGTALLPLGLILFVVSPRSTYYLAIFFIPFTASSLLNLKSGVPLTPGQYFGGIFILYAVIRVLWKSRLPAPWRQERAVIWSMVFALILLISVLQPHVFFDSARYGSSIASVASRSVLDDLKPTLVVIFGIVFLYFTITHNPDVLALKRTLRVYLASGIFVSLWGFFEFACDYYLDLEYPAFVFNNALLPSMQGYRQYVLIDDVPYLRIASVAHEPSILAKIMLTMVPILLTCILLKTTIMTWMLDRLALVLIIGIMMITTAATAYYGLIVCLLVTGSMVVLFNRRLPVKYFLTKILLVPALTLGLFLVEWEIPRNILNWAFFQKLSSGSGVQRLDYIVDAYSIFERYPVFGAGWARVTSHDLVIYLLANAGILGLAGFCILIAVAGINSVRAISLANRNPERVSRLSLALMIALPASLISLLVVGAATGLEFYLPHFYLILAMVMSINLIIRKECSAENSPLVFTRQFFEHGIK